MKDFSETHERTSEIFDCGFERMKVKLESVSERVKELGGDLALAICKSAVDQSSCFNQSKMMANELASAVDTLLRLNDQSAHAAVTTQKATDQLAANMQKSQFLSLMLIFTKLYKDDLPRALELHGLAIQMIDIEANGMVDTVNTAKKVMRA
jgi:hypothetical protein